MLYISSKRGAKEEIDTNSIEFKAKKKRKLENEIKLWDGNLE
jgi:hypothetical protein